MRLPLKSYMSSDVEDEEGYGTFSIDVYGHLTDSQASIMPLYAYLFRIARFLRSMMVHVGLWHEFVSHAKGMMPLRIAYLVTALYHE